MEATLPPSPEGVQGWERRGVICLFPLAVISLPSRKQGQATIQLAKGTVPLAKCSQGSPTGMSWSSFSSKWTPHLDHRGPGSTYPRVRKPC